MDQRTRDNIARIVLEARGLSKCRKPSAAAVVRGEKLTAVCSSGDIPGQDDISTSAVVEAILQDVEGGHHKGDPVLICSKFPSLEDFKVLYATDVREVHFMGDLDDPDAVAFLNRISKTCPEQGFRIVQLEMQK